MFVRPVERTETVNSPLLSGWKCCLQERKEAWKGAVFAIVLSGTFQLILYLHSVFAPQNKRIRETCLLIEVHI